MTAQEVEDFERGSVLVLDELHREIDRLTLTTYGWEDLIEPTYSADDRTAELLRRLVALNAERAAAEARGEVRWLRPDYQIPRFAKGTVTGPEQVRDLIGETSDAKAARPAFPADRTGQHLAVLTLLHTTPEPLSPADIAAGFKGREVAPRVDKALRALARLGYAQPTPDGRAYRARRAA